MPQSSHGVDLFWYFVTALSSLTVIVTAWLVIRSRRK